MDENERARLYRQLDIEPTNLAVLEALIQAEMDAGDTSTIVQRLRVAAFHLEQASDGRGALAVFERLAKLDREATRNLTSLALTCGRLLLPPKLVPYLSKAIGVVEQRGVDALVEWTTRICRLPADSLELSREIANPITSVSQQDPVALMRNAEMHQKLGDNKSAAQSFAAVAAQFAKDGYFLKAVALFKQVLRLEPGPQPAIELRLGELHARLQLFSEAEAYFRRAEEQFTNAGDLESAEVARRASVEARSRQSEA